MTINIEYLVEPNDWGLVVLEGSPNGGLPYDNLILFIEEDGQVKVGIRTTYTSNDGVPQDEWYDRTLTIWITTAAVNHRALCFDDLRAFLEGKRVQSLLKRIIDGHDVRWDGSNYQGWLNEDARDALVSLERLLNEQDWDCGWTAWDADDWLRAAGSIAQAARDAGLTVDTSLDEISLLAIKLFNAALSDKQWIVGGEEALLHALCRLQDDLRQEAEGESELEND